MARWFKLRITERGLTKLWKLRLRNTTLSTLENLLAARRIASIGTVLYFCEKTHEKKATTLASKIFGRRIRVVSIDFNTSPPRYDTATRRAMDREDVQYSLRALKDPGFRHKLNKANKEKIRVLRKTSPARRRVEIERIARRVRRDYMASK